MRFCEPDCTQRLHLPRSINQKRVRKRCGRRQTTTRSGEPPTADKLVDTANDWRRDDACAAVKIFPCKKFLQPHCTQGYFGIRSASLLQHVTFCIAHSTQNPKRTSCIVHRPSPSRPVLAETKIKPAPELVCFAILFLHVSGQVIWIDRSFEKMRKEIAKVRNKKKSKSILALFSCIH